MRSLGLLEGPLMPAPAPAAAAKRPRQAAPHLAPAASTNACEPISLTRARRAQQPPNRLVCLDPHAHRRMGVDSAARW